MKKSSRIDQELGFKVILHSREFFMTQRFLNEYRHQRVTKRLSVVNIEHKKLIVQYELFKKAFQNEISGSDGSII